MSSPNPTGKLLSHFEPAHLELVLADQVILQAALDEASHRALRQRVHAAREQLQELIDWLGAARLDAPSM